MSTDPIHSKSVERCSQGVNQCRLVSVSLILARLRCNQVLLQIGIQWPPELLLMAATCVARVSRGRTHFAVVYHSVFPELRACSEATMTCWIILWKDAAVWAGARSNNDWVSTVTTGKNCAKKWGNIPKPGRTLPLGHYSFVFRLPLELRRRWRCSPTFQPENVFNDVTDRLVKRVLHLHLSFAHRQRQIHLMSIYFRAKASRDPCHFELQKTRSRW